MRNPSDKPMSARALLQTGMSCSTPRLTTPTQAEDSDVSPVGKGEIISYLGALEPKREGVGLREQTTFDMVAEQLSLFGTER